MEEKLGPVTSLTEAKLVANPAAIYMKIQ